MELCTFEINLTNKEITFVFSDSDLKRRNRQIRNRIATSSALMQ